MTRYKRSDDCPDKINHTKQPSGYIEWHAFAEKMLEKHRQVRCPTCGFLSIWIPWQWRENAKAEDDYDYINS